MNPHSLAYGLSRSGLISVHRSIKCFATIKFDGLVSVYSSVKCFATIKTDADATKAKKLSFLLRAWQHKMTEAAAVVPPSASAQDCQHVHSTASAHPPNNTLQFGLASDHRSSCCMDVSCAALYAHA